MKDVERNQFLKTFHGSGAHHKGVDPHIFELVTEMRKLLYRFGRGWISEYDCAITAGTCGAQWEMRIRDAKAKQHAAGVSDVAPSPLDKLILPKGSTPTAN